MKINSELDFYKNLSAFRDFSEVVEDQHFAPVPDSWLVVISDICGSTRAIQEGRYRDVNMVGAATIACILNALNSNEVPFVFGGDGSTVLVSQEDWDSVKIDLLSLIEIAKRSFQLELRVGTVAVGKLRAAGADLVVGKYELSPGNYTAQIKGGGLTLAEEMVKKGHPEGATLLQWKEKVAPPRVDGLSCRIEPIPARNGIMLSLLVKPTSSNANAILNDVLTQMKVILSGDFLSARPVSRDRLLWKWPSPTLTSETRLNIKSAIPYFNFAITALNALVAKILLTFNIRLGSFEPAKYATELVTNSDFKKFDETLRMVIDCSEAQADAIERLLEDQRANQRLQYGLHRSTEAVMTCVVRSASNNQHIHFIDGGSGGYALAALQLKERR